MMLPGAAPLATLEIALTGLRSDRGMLQLCLAARADDFPDCAADPHAIRRSLPAQAPYLRISDIPPGEYAAAVIHDENGNARLDTFAGIPREGFGFSGNPAIRFGPPRFDAARFTLVPDATVQHIRMRYLL